MQIVIVGVGKMGVALLEGITARGIIPPSEIGLVDIETARVAAVAERFGVRLMQHHELSETNRMILCLQPRAFSEMTEWLAQENTGYISTMAGVSVNTLVRRLGTRRVVRVMPNLAASIGYSQTAMTTLKEAQEAGDVAVANQIFGAVGDVYDLPESLFHAFTGLNASGVGYMAMVAESLADGAIRMGMPRALAYELAAKTLVASGFLLQQRIHPALLKDEVASPAGTAMTGIEALEQANIRNALMQAVIAGTRRSQELERDQDEV